MKSLVDNKADLPLRIVVFAVIVILSGLPLWLSTYREYLNNLLISGVSTFICVIAAGLITFKTSYKKIQVILYTLIAHQAALIIKMVIDCIPDKSNHNLAPFEMVMLFGFDFVVVGLITLIIPSKKG